MKPSWHDTDFFRPLINAWLGKVDAAYRSEARIRFIEEAEEAKVFYSRSCASLWNSRYASKFLSGAIEKPKFPISVNKTFEAIAVLVPNMLWDISYRTVKPKKRLDLDEETMAVFQQDPEDGQILPYLLQHDERSVAEAKVVASLLQLWLNYSSREVPDGGLSNHARLATNDAMLTGRGVQFVRTYEYPGSHRTLTGCFREDPLDVVIDPDVKKLEDAKWIMLRHQTKHWELEQRFKLPKDSLKDAASLESTWDYGERIFGQQETTTQSKHSRDVVVWCEVWSKLGVGCRLVPDMEPGLRKHLEEVVGEYAYVAFTSSVPWPLNCHPESLRRGATDEEVKEAFAWPFPTYADNRWPCDFLDWYPDPDSVYPIAPMSPGMGHLKFINIMVPFLCERTHTATRNFWAVADSDAKYYKKYLEEGAHNTVIPIRNYANMDDVRKAITMLEQPAANSDAWKVIEMANEWFGLATGLTPFMYGSKGMESNDRSARETEARARAAGIRIDYMQKELAAFQSRLEAIEAFAARWFVRGADLVPLAGEAGRWLWDKYVRTSDVELVVREMTYEVAASSISRPDRERDLDAWIQGMQQLWGNYFEYGAATGNFGPANHLVVNWAKTIHMDEPERLALEPVQDDAAQQQAQQEAAIEQAKSQAELQGKQLDLAGKQIDIQGKKDLVAIQTQSKVVEALVAQQKARIELEAQTRKAELEVTKGMQSLQVEGAKQEANIATQVAQSALKLRQQTAG